MKTIARALMLALSFAAATPANANGPSLPTNVPIETKMLAARTLADAAARNDSTAEERKTAIDIIGKLAKSMTTGEQEQMAAQVSMQMSLTAITAVERAEEKKDSAVAGATILALGLVIALLTRKSGRISRLAAGASIGGGLLAIYNGYVATGIILNTEANLRELHAAMTDLTSELRLKNKAESI